MAVVYKSRCSSESSGCFPPTRKTLDLTLVEPSPSVAGPGSSDAVRGCCWPERERRGGGRSPVLRGVSRALGDIDGGSLAVRQRRSGRIGSIRA